MLQFLKNMGNILPLTAHSIIPCLILGLSVVGYYIIEEISPLYMQTLHWNIYILGIFSMGVLGYFNRNKPLFFMLSILIAYLLINNIRRIDGAEFIYNFSYQNLCVLLPLNLLVFYMLPKRRFISKETLYLLIGFLLELSIMEHFSKEHSLGWNYAAKGAFTFSHVSLLFAIICGIIILFRASMSGKIVQSYLLFAYIEVIFGLIYADNSSALTMMFFTAIATTFIAICYEVYHTTYHDELTELLSRNSFIINSKKFPLKYGIGIICIDDFSRMNKIFRQHEVQALVKMISLLISDVDSETLVYRYGVDEFVVIYKNENKEETFQKVEEIRRKIAAAEFVLNQRKKTIKLTVSAGVSEKKRSDANAFEVLVRTRKALEQTNKFSQNITSKA